MRPLKLHEIAEKSKIYEESSDGSEFIIFHHIDGMYSYCVTEKGAPVHLSAVTPLVVHEDGFKIAE